VDAVDPALLVGRAVSRRPLPSVPPDRVTVIAAGKAAWPMARGLAAHLPRVSSALIAGLHAGEETGWPRIERIDAPHPAPDERSERAGRAALALASAVPADGVLIVLISGGASSMLAVPAEGLSLIEKAAAAEALMQAGVPIADLNCVRKHLSAVKGGRLAAAARWRTVTLALSDVHGPVPDDPSVIASGPTVTDPTTFAEALAIVRESGAQVPARARACLEAGARGEVPETPKSAPITGEPPRFEVVGNRHTAMAAAAAAAAAHGYAVVVVEPATEGEARSAGLRFVSQAIRAAGSVARPLCVIASGETVVTIAGGGRGGRNQEFALGALPELEALSARGIVGTLGSAGTDGVDGPTDAAGAIVSGTTGRDAREAGLDVAAALGRNDAYPLLRALDCLITWGPTGTNVGDLHVLVLAP
jgi:glycerate 2-kinase